MSVLACGGAGHANLGRKLRGVIQFMEDWVANGILAEYDFNRLRRKLGLVGAAAPVERAGEGIHLDILSMSTADLGSLPMEPLTTDQLEMAYQASQKLDAHELASSFARTLISRPPVPGKTDRYPYYSYLVQRALHEGRPDEALDIVNEGEKADCEQNDGGRRNDYELRRGQVHAKRGEAGQAAAGFQHLIDRIPPTRKYRGAAAGAL